MKFENVMIAGLAAALPENVVTSLELEEQLSPLYKRLKLQAGRLELMTGIAERRFWQKGLRPSDVATIAGKRAIAASGIPAEKIGACIHASVCRDFLEPATANIVHNSLGLPDNCYVYDISNACLGVLNGMVTVANMIQAGQIEAGIVVSGEMGESLVETTIEALNSDQSLTRKTVKSAFASLTIGSAGAAVLLSSSTICPSGHKLLGGKVRSATKYNNLCQSTTADAGMSGKTSPLMDTDSEQLLRAGCELAAETFPLFKKELNWKNDDIDKAITHQVGVAHKKLLYESLHLDVSKDYPTVQFMGNTGSAALPSALAIAAEENAIKKGERVALLGIGSGLNSLMLGVEW